MRRVTDQLRIAGKELTASDAVDVLRRYGEWYGLTVELYDHGGREPANEITLEDIGRLTVIDAQLKGKDTAPLLHSVSEKQWKALAPAANFLDLPDHPRSHPDFKAASDIYDALRKNPGIKWAKSTKLMHLKRPLFVPIVDSVVRGAYLKIASAEKSRLGLADRPIWSVIWSDARWNEPMIADVVRPRLRASGSVVADLSSLRLHDILIWSQFRTSRGTRSVD